LYILISGTVAVAHSGPHTVIAESHNVSMAVVVDVDDKSRMLLHAPSLVKAKVIQDTPEIVTKDTIIIRIFSSP
jgi:hypothetical protein